MHVIKVNARDNVAACVVEEGLPEGTWIEVCSVRLQEYLPFGHKVALIDLAKGDPIIRYGHPVALATEDIPMGSPVTPKNTKYWESQSLEAYRDLPFHTEDAGYEIPDLSKRTFLGYVNADGSVATKNILALHTTVQCVAGVVNKAVDLLRKELANYPNVDDVVGVTHDYGCGVAIKAKSAYIPKKIISNMSKNPNLRTSSLVVSLGCEKFLPQDAFPHIPEEDIVVLQNEMGFRKMMDILLAKARNKLAQLNERKRQAVPIEKLNLGVQCGGSDSFSGMSSNNVIGYAVDALAKAGAKVCFSELTEVRDGAEQLMRRMRTKETRDKFIHDVRWYDQYLDREAVDRAANPTPGNLAGGLLNIVDKAMGSINKSGFGEIVDVVSYGDQLTKPGLTFLSTPASDFYCGSNQLAAGVTLQLFSTGRGTPYNLREYPVIKLSSNNKLGHKWADLVDLNCGEIFGGEKTIEDLGQELIELIIAVASGEKKTWADTYDIYNEIAVFNPAPIT